MASSTSKKNTTKPTNELASRPPGKPASKPTNKPANKPAKKLPRTFLAFTAKYPELGRAHEAIAKAVDSAGPLDARTCALIKIGLSVGAGLESATRSHVRRAMQYGASREEVEQAILLAMNTCGFPRTVAAWSWAQEQFARKD